MDIVLLPGLDGTGTLFVPFIRKSPAWANPVVISYDRDKIQDYEQLASTVSKSLNQEQPYILVGESFSGPVALLVAARAPKNLVGVVLCASFVINPRPLLSLLYFPALFQALFRAGVPAWSIRYFLTGRESSQELVKAVRSAIKSVSPDVLIARLNMVIETNVIEHLTNCTIPLLYISTTQDRLIPKKSLTVIRTVKPDVSVIPVDGPHFILQSNPVDVWEAISNFVNVNVVNHTP